MCPNGTIFRQLDLICDWWFKVDCASSPGHYVESSETLFRDQRRRNEQKKQLAHEFNAESVSSEHFKQIAERRVGKALLTSGRRMDSSFYKSEPNPDSIESFEFIDLPVTKKTQNTARIHYTAKLKTIPAKRRYEAVSSSASKELQEVAESASFVKPRALGNGYNYPVPPSPQSKGQAQSKPTSGYVYPKPEKIVDSLTIRPTDRTGKRLETSKPTGFGYEPTKTNSNSFEPKPFHTRPTEILSTSPASPTTSTTTRSTTTTTVEPTTYQPTSTAINRGSTNYFSSLEKERERIQQFFSSTSLGAIRSTTPIPSTYSTAKKLTPKGKLATFYTPTIPTITKTVSKEQTSARPAPTQPTPHISEHALEMMKTLQELEGVKTSEAQPYSGPRAGLEVPPSSGPSAIHSLALYFATTTLENNATEPTPVDYDFDTQTETSSDAGVESSTQVISQALLSEKTVNQYEALFQAEKQRVETTTASKVNTRFEETNDLEAENSRNPIYAAAGSPQIRELAQVFTHALSAYLQDPETFRKILSEIRPTEPPPLVESNEVVESRFKNKDILHRQESSYSVSKTATTSTTASPTEDFEVLDFSDVTISTRRAPVTTTTIPSTTVSDDDSNAHSSVPVPRGRILPPLSSNSIDRTAKSQKIPEESSGDNYNQQDKSETTTAANPLAIEINGGLALSTTFPYDSEEALGDKLEKNNNQLDEFSTQTPTTTNVSPTITSDILPPFKATTKPLPPSKYYEPPKEDEEELQRSQSQSIFGGVSNQIRENQKRGKSYFNYVTIQESTRFPERTTTQPPPETTTAASDDLKSNGHFITRKIIIPDEADSTPSPDVFKTTLPDVGRLNTNSKTTVSYSVFLDPLTINDGLLESSENGNDSVTPSQHTYLPKDLTTEWTPVTTSYSSTTYGQPSSTRQGKSQSTSGTSSRFSEMREDQELIGVMQKKANEMFGNLNETQVDHLMNVMKQADKNKNVRRLILLLIQTCDDDYNKTVEESRNALLNALIQMDTNNVDLSDVRIINTRNNRLGKSLAETVSTETPVITTYRSANHNRYTSQERTVEYSYVTSTSVAEPTTEASLENRFSGESLDFETTTNYYATETTEAPYTTETTTTEVPTTVTTTTTTTTTTTAAPSTTASNRQSRSRGRTRTQNNRVQKSLGVSEDFVAESSSHYGGNNSKHSDARALELLRSLYSLASRWG